MANDSIVTLDLKIKRRAGWGNIYCYGVVPAPAFTPPSHNPGCLSPAREERNAVAEVKASIGDSDTPTDCGQRPVFPSSGAR